MCFSYIRAAYLTLQYCRRSVRCIQSALSTLVFDGSGDCAHIRAVVIYRSFFCAAIQLRDDLLPRILCDLVADSHLLDGENILSCSFNMPGESCAMSLTDMAIRHGMWSTAKILAGRFGVPCLRGYTELQNYTGVEGDLHRHNSGLISGAIQCSGGTTNRRNEPAHVTRISAILDTLVQRGKLAGDIAVLVCSFAAADCVCITRIGSESTESKRKRRHDE